MTSDTDTGRIDLSMDELMIWEIEGTAHWRTLKAEEYPEDERNLKEALKNPAAVTGIG